MRILTRRRAHRHIDHAKKRTGNYHIDIAHAGALKGIAQGVYFLQATIGKNRLGTRLMVVGGAVSGVNLKFGNGGPGGIRERALSRRRGHGAVRKRRVQF